MKALDFLKEQQQMHKNMAKSMSIVYFDDELDEAIAELEAISFQIKELEMMEEDAQQYALKCRNELEALQSKSCEGCKHGKYGADSRGIEVECTLIWHCARGNGFPDRYKPKDTK